MSSNLIKKIDTLRTKLAEMGSMALGFSGGVDSTFLGVIAHEVLGENFLALIAIAPVYPKSEQQEAITFAKEHGFRYQTISAEIWNQTTLKINPVERCYICKKSLFSNLIRVTHENNLKYVADGSNVDDQSDFRPGMKALKELGIKSPLMEAGFTKNEIRKLSQEMGLPTWDKPPMACLATRFPFGHALSNDKFRMVDEAETFIRSLGFKMVRVRHVDDTARIELDSTELSELFNAEYRNKIMNRLSGLGYKLILVDLEGYKMGKMNPE